MAHDKTDVRVDETLHRNGDRIVEAEYIYNETRSNDDSRKYQVLVKRQDYERLAGQHAAEDIPEAFRLLDADHSDTIDIGELAAFMSVIVPDGNLYMLLHHVQKVDQNHDCKLNLGEFTALINRGVERDMTLRRL